MTSAKPDDHLVYIADPMCSWCWAFAPVIKQAEARFAGRLGLHVMVGGLAVGTTKVMDEAAKKTVREHWEHVAELAGRPFDFGFFERSDFVYDTAPACRAVVAARRLQAERTLDFLIALHEAFYANNRDITDRAVLLDAAEAFGFARAAFAEAFDSEEVRAETEADVRACRRVGIEGYPALLGSGGETGYSILTLGYQPWNKMAGIIGAWLDYRDREAGRAGKSGLEWIQ